MQLEEIIQKTSEIGKQIVQDEVRTCDRDYTWHTKGMRAMQEAGLAGLTIPTQHGGLGGGLYALTRVCEELGKTSASMGICYGMHCVGAAVIASKATDYQVEKYLKPICEGRHITTLTLSEPGTGAHFYFPESTSKQMSNGDYQVNGTKTFTTNGKHADSYVVSVVVQGEGVPPGHFSCVMIDKDSEGMQWGGPWTGIGMRGNSSLTMEMKNIQVKQEHLLGNEGDQIWYIFQVVAPYFLTAMAGTYLGLADAAFEEAKVHLMNRVHNHNQQSLAEIQILQHRLGEMWTELEKTRRLIYFAAEEADKDGPLAIPALCAAKAAVADSAVSIVNKAMTLCGGKGYRDGGNLERMLRDVRAADVMSPTTDLLKTWIGRALLEQPLLS